MNFEFPLQQSYMYSLYHYTRLYKLVHFFPAPAPQLTSTRPSKPQQLFPSGKYAPSYRHLSLCIVNSRPNTFNISSPDSAEIDDEEMVSAAEQCEAQLNTGVAYDTNANIMRMFSDNTKNIILWNISTF